MTASRATTLLLVAAALAGCALPEGPIQTLSVNDSCATAYGPAPCPEVTTTPLPFDGVAGTPDVPLVSTTPTPTPATATPTPASSTPTPATSTPTPSTPSASTPKRVKGALRIGASPVDDDGNAIGAAWGGWDARPGEKRPSGVNYILVTNTAEDADARFRVTFDASAFSGTRDSSFIVPITGNIEFAVVEPSGAALQRGVVSRDTLAWAPGDLPTGLTVTIHKPHGMALVAYRIIDFPPILLEQPYAAPFHVEELAS